MRKTFLSPRSFIRLFSAILLSSTPQALANPHPPQSELAGFSFNELFARYDCAGTYCGFSSQLCCTGGAGCFTDSNNQAQCGSAPTPAAAGGGGGETSGGHWQYYTTTLVMTDTSTVTKVYSSYVGGAQPTPGAKSCNYALMESPCGLICCTSNQYCFQDGQCNPIGGGASSTYFSPVHTSTSVTGAGAPIRPTSSGQTIVTQTDQRTATPITSFMPAVATGANVTLTESHSSSGLSGGAIAGIVIGVLLALALLALLCFCCIVKGLFDTVAALFGFGRKRRRVEVEEYERRSHHASGGAGRTWYGAAKPSRTSRYEEKKESRSDNKRWLGVLGALAAFWAILGLKRRGEDRRRREEEKYSEGSYLSYDYTSASSASSDDRRTREASRTRDTRRSASRRSVSRRSVSRR